MITTITEYIVTINFAPFVGVLFMLLYLFMNGRIDKEVKNKFFMLLVAEIVELAAYSWELVTAQWEEPTLLRIFLSAVGYSFRPIMVYLILLLAMRIPHRSKRALLYFLPAAVNIIVSFSAFFTDLAYSYNEKNVFVRGPLGLSSQIVICIYLFWILIVTFTRVHKRSGMETVIVFADVFLCVFAMTVEAVYKFRSFGRTSVIMATIFYFMYFQSSLFAQQVEETRSANTELKKISQLDALTGLLNKKTFMEKVEQTLNDTVGISGVMFFFDLDNFKGYNDTFGHLAGDELLKNVGYRLKAVFRESDFIGRFGGDEFYIFMNDVPCEIVAEKAEQLRQILTIKSEGGKADVTASIGVVYAEKAVTADELIKLADSALYEAKAKGKNRYVIREL